MSQHSQRTQFGPSRASVVTTGVLVAVSAVATGYSTSGPWDEDQVVALVLGAALTVLLLARTFGLMAERAVVADRIEREAERAEREYQAALDSGKIGEMDAWMNATAGLLDAYLTGRALDFHGETVPEYVRTRLTDLPPPVARRDAEPAEEPDATQVHYWTRGEPYVEPDPVAREVDRAVTEHLDKEVDPHGYVADPVRPWRAFEPVSPQRAELAQVPVPLPPREGTGWHGDETEVMPRVRDERWAPREGTGWHGDETEVMSRVRDDDETEVIERVQS